MRGRDGSGLTRPMQDYLRVIYELGRDGEVSTSRLAGGLGVSGASATGMVKRLALLGLVSREPYREVMLTEAGKRAALGVVRRHRLAELYLTEALGYSWEDVHVEADELEHAISEGLENRLDESLGHPRVDPHGSPIPKKDGTIEEQEYASLAETEAGQRVVVRRVSDGNAEMLSYLADTGIVLGSEVEITERHPFDGPVEVDVGGQTRFVGLELARHIFVERMPVEAARSQSSERMPG